MIQKKFNPILFAVYDDVDTASAAVRDLREVGFTPQEISVLCSDEHRERLFSKYEHEDPAGSHADQAITGAAATALGLGGSAVAVGLLTSAGTAIFVLGAFAGVAAISTFVSLMLTRGAEKELADYYDQAVLLGKILVGVETNDAARQKQAREIFERHGYQAGSLPKEF
ncbi:MAG: hypothetical protein WEB58_09915 [Planctomycetaceae bacterium]